MSYYRGWRPYVPVHERQAQAAREVARLRKKGEATEPVAIEGRTIARTFWGRAWCENLESYSDYENRLPRGRTYVRNGSVIDLKIEPGQVIARVSGSDLYRVAIRIKGLDPARWRGVVEACHGKIDSVVELLQGRLSSAVMEVLTHRSRGLFPAPGAISMDCSCPDWATMCKHVAAVLYGVGARLDTRPELLFTLRQVDQAELVARVGLDDSLGRMTDAGHRVLDDADLGDLFGIDLDGSGPAFDATPTAPSGHGSPGRPSAVPVVAGPPPAPAPAAPRPPAPPALAAAAPAAARAGAGDTRTGAGQRKRPAFVREVKAPPAPVEPFSPPPAATPPGRRPLRRSRPAKATSVTRASASPRPARTPRTDRVHPAVTRPDSARRRGRKAPDRAASRPMTRPVRAGQILSSEELIAMGIPRSTFQNWVTNGVLAQTRTPGCYRATASTRARIHQTLERMGLVHDPEASDDHPRRTSRGHRNPTPRLPARTESGTAPGRMARAPHPPASPAPGSGARPARQARRPDLLREGQILTTEELIRRGIPRSTFQNWPNLGILERTDRPGEYRATARTAEAIRRTLERLGAVRSPRRGRPGSVD